MKEDLQCQMKAYIQPFERRLALAELAALSNAKPKPLEGALEEALTFVVPSTPTQKAKLLKQLAYWESVGAKDRQCTTQVLREASTNLVKNGIPLSEIEGLVAKRAKAVLPNRRCLRYGTHGLHEYRGKFFPQLVRALLNAAAIPADAVVADPMCGSGTTAVEAVMGGYRALGLDMNPLSVLMAETKCSLLEIDPALVVSVYEEIHTKLLRHSVKKPFEKLPYFKSLSEEDQVYLKGWFSEQVLADLDQIAWRIKEIENVSIRNFMWLGLSNILRSVSWQKNDDLRVRKEVRLDADIDPIREFLEEIGRSVRLLLAFLYQNPNTHLGTFAVQHGDARQLYASWAKWTNKVDVIITSPPYATALPYLDTDRLSLCYLGLLARPQHRKRDQAMIGNREITEKTRQSYWSLLEENRNHLPASVTSLIAKVHEMNLNTDVGFRRRNLPALLTKYFLDMHQVLSGMKELLRPGHRAFVVVGNNHTIAGGTRVEIDTPSLLVDLAESLGFHTGDRIPMEMLVSRDIFRKNAVASEEILCFKKSI